MVAIDTEEEQVATIYYPHTEKQKEVAKLYTEFELREVFKDNHGTEDLYTISFCPDPRPHIIATTASNHLSVFDLVYRSQWVSLQLKFVNSISPITGRSADPIEIPKEKEFLSFSWLAHQPFRALAGTRGGEIKRFHLQRNTRELKPFTEKHAGPVTTIVGFFEGKYAVSLSKINSEVRLWDCDNPQSCLHRAIIPHAVSLTPSPEDKSVLIVCKNCLQKLTIQKFDAGCVAVRIDIILDAMKGTNGKLQTCKILSPDEIVLVSERSSVSIWSLTSKSRVGIWKSSEMTKSAESFDVCRTTGVCVIGCTGGAIEIRDVCTGLLHKRIEHRRIPEKISFTHVGIARDGQCIVAGSGEKIYKFSKKYDQNWRSPCEFTEQ